MPRPSGSWNWDRPLSSDEQQQAAKSDRHMDRIWPGLERMELLSNGKLVFTGEKNEFDLFDHNSRVICATASLNQSLMYRAQRTGAMSAKTVRNGTWGEMADLEPFVYVRTDGTFVFATEAEKIIVVPDGPPAIRLKPF